MTDKDFAAIAELLEFDVPQPCRDGVEGNLRLLAVHARVLDTWLEEEDAP